jgi:predicted dehydrogenase
MSRLRLLVIGAGHMGRLHAEKAAALADEVELAGVVDPHPERAEPLVRSYGGTAATDPRALAEKADAAIVAVPTVAHARVAGALLDAGLDVLVEKPIAATLADAEALVARARRGGRVLQVGHLEWWNPAFRAAHGSLARPRFVEAHRLGPFPGRGTDVDVVRDLMIHDIDLVQRVLGEEPESIEADGSAVRSTRLDVANARLHFPGGCVAELTASRVSPDLRRDILFRSAEEEWKLDLLAGRAGVLRRVTAEGEPPRLQSEALPVAPADALLAQLRDFVAAVRTRLDPTRSAEAALAALRTALRVVDAIPEAGAP